MDLFDDCNVMNDYDDGCDSASTRQGFIHINHNDSEIVIYYNVSLNDSSTV